MSNLKAILEKNKITNLKLFYEGFYNKTYRGFFYDELVQVRVTKNNIINHDDEIKFLKQHNDVIYIDQEIMIKKWIPGKILDSHNKEILIKIKDKLTKHWSTKILDIGTLNYDSSHKIEEFVLSHGDLRPKNIIIDSENEIHLIDFEWIKYTDIYFDLAHLYLYCFFSIEDINDVFEVDIDELKKRIQLVKKFNNNWEKNNLH